jgi:diguanylate cyclase (GGDEF)-like protein
VFWIGRVILLDLDRFGAINKSAGHAAGDAALTRAVQQMQRVAGDHGVVGRPGGDEFAVVLAGGDPEPTARRMLADVIAKPVSGPALDASVGVARFPRDGENAESLLRAVDVALRVAKRSGISQLSVYAGDPVTGKGPGRSAGSARAAPRRLGYVRQTGGHLVAEGVETEAELDTLEALGVTLVQGYLLGRPQAPWPNATMPGRAVAPGRDPLTGGSAVSERGAPPGPPITLHDAPV